MATSAVVAQHLDLSPDRVRALQRLGVLPTASRGNLDLDECRVRYIRHLRAGASGRGIAGGGEEGIKDLSAERARLAAEQADGQEMKNAQLRGELLPREEVSAAVQSAFGRTKARLLTIPTKAAAIVIQQPSAKAAKAVLTDFVHEALAELAITQIAEEHPDDQGRTDGRRS